MINYASPNTKLPLQFKRDSLVDKDGNSYPIINEIPRFVDSDNYAKGFGLEWTIHYNTQLDSHTNTTISRDRLNRCFGSPLEDLKAKNVLECGCGSGRFTEILAKHGANVHSIDLSVAVDANKKNLRGFENYTIAQADIYRIPYPPNSFDVVVCLGVIQHTPSSERCMESLWKMVKPGGKLVMDHYSWSLSLITKLAPLYRYIFIYMKPEKAKRVIDKLTDFFFPLHYQVRNIRPLQILLSRISPCLVYFNLYPELSKEQHYQFCKLDTFDHLTDFYKHIRSKNQIKKKLALLGAVNIHCWRDGNGVEAWCEKPV